MARKFPRLKTDGSFSFIVKYRLKDGEALDRDELSKWIQLWVDQNNPWIRHWSSGKIQTLEFFESFRDLPKVLSIESLSVELLFDCPPESPPESRWWKDWYVKFSGDLIKAWPSIEDVEQCRNVDQ